MAGPIKPSLTGAAEAMVRRLVYEMGVDKLERVFAEGEPRMVLVSHDRGEGTVVFRRLDGGQSISLHTAVQVTLYTAKPEDKE